jgi:hypothetical protein
MEEQSAQSQTAPERIHNPSDWAAKLQESTKIASNEEEQSLAPQEEELESEELLDDSDPTSSEDELDEANEEDTEVEALDTEEEAEPSDTEPQLPSIEADTTVIIDGQEVNGQEILNGLEATRNFRQEKHRLREENRVEHESTMSELHTKRDEYAAGLNMMLGMNQQAQQQFSNVNWQDLQMNNPAEYQKQQQAYGQLVGHQQQLQGQFDQFLTNVKGEQAEQQRLKADSSLSILRDTFGGDEGWRQRYPELGKIAGDLGFSAQEFNVIDDYRMMNLFDELGKTKAKLAAIESTTQKKAANPVKVKGKRNSQRVNTTNTRKTSDAHNTFMKSRKPKDAAALIMQSQTKRSR